MLLGHQIQYYLHGTLLAYMSVAVYKKIQAVVTVDEINYDS